MQCGNRLSSKFTVVSLKKVILHYDGYKHKHSSDRKITFSYKLRLLFVLKVKTTHSPIQ